MAKSGQTYYDPTKTQEAIFAVNDELQRALNAFAPFNSAHEGFAVIKEEVDELWEEVRANKHTDPTRMHKEAVQVAAMAVRFVLDITPRTMGKEVTRGD